MLNDVKYIFLNVLGSKFSLLIITKEYTFTQQQIKYLTDYKVIIISFVDY